LRHCGNLIWSRWQLMIALQSTPSRDWRPFDPKSFSFHTASPKRYQQCPAAHINSNSSPYSRLASTSVCIRHRSRNQRERTWRLLVEARVSYDSWRKPPDIPAVDRCRSRKFMALRGLTRYRDRHYYRDVWRSLSRFESAKFGAAGERAMRFRGLPPGRARE
jgi:hypothetical protein